MSTTDARVAFGCIRPLKEGDEGARGSCFITKVQVIATGIVEIHSFFDEAQTQDLRVKIHGSLGIGTDNGDVMDTLNGHGFPPFKQTVTVRSMHYSRYEHDTDTVDQKKLFIFRMNSPHSVVTYI